MLVLSRHASETIRIGDNIVVSIQRISGNRVIIGIDAPQEVAIRRGELAFEGDANVRAEESQAVRKSSGRDAASTDEQGSSAPPSSSGLAARTRVQDRRPIIMPMGERAADWSASPIS